MNNVNDLNKTSGNIRANNEQPISLSAIGNKQEPTISINTTNGLTGVQEEQPTERQVIKINTNRVIRPHRTFNSESEVNIINPDDYIEKPPAVRPKTPHDIAIDLLAEAVDRKKKEYSDFVEAAIEDDKNNREKVEAGIESVGDELQYIPDNLYEPVPDSDKVTPIDQPANDDQQSDFDIGNPSDTNYGHEEPDDFDEEDIMNYNVDDDNVEMNNTVVTANISNGPFFDGTIEIKDNNDIKELFENPKVDFEDTKPVEIEADTYETPVIDEAKEYEVDPAVIEPEQKDVEAPIEHRLDEDIDQIVQDTISSGSFDMTSSALKEDPSTEDFEIDESDFEDVAPAEQPEDEISDEEAQALYEAAERNIKAEILKKIIRAGRRLDTTQFVVSNKVINIKDAIRDSDKKVQRTGSWPMMFAGRPFKASALKGPEIALLADTDDSDSNTSIGITMEQAKILFEHDANPYRPNTLEAWAKTIPIYDVESIFAALYVASLKDSNYIPMACSKRSCQHAYLTDNIKIEDMIKFNNDTAKAKFDEIQQMALTPENSGSYESVVNVVNDKFAVGLKIPSVFTMLYEYSSLTPEFVNKYTTMVSIIHYIDYIYLINEDTQQFQPVGWKTYPGDNAKTFKSKIATYAKILKELDDTDFSILMALIHSMVDKSDLKYLSYQIPAVKCPKCGTEIPAREIFPRGMLFTRQRLVELATTPSEK